MDADDTLILLLDTLLAPTPQRAIAVFASVVLDELRRCDAKADAIRAVTELTKTAAAWQPESADATERRRRASAEILF